MTKVSFGTISEGTLRTDDLLEAFASELESLEPDNALSREACEVDSESEKANHLVDELQDALGEHAPPYTYFGTLEGDGAHFGFWPSIDALEMAVSDGEVLKVNDLSEIPEHNSQRENGDWRDVMLVNDHDNVALYSWEHNPMSNLMELKEIWAAV